MPRHHYLDDVAQSNVNIKKARQYSYLESVFLKHTKMGKHIPNEPRMYQMGVRRPKGH
jgi:hypothetical protein